MHDSSARRPTTGARVVAVDGTNSLERPDRLVTEEPMEIRIHAPGQSPAPLAVTMRTPGNDFELAVGFCLTEQVVAIPHHIATVAYCLSGDGPQEYNVVTVTTRTAVDLEAHQRAFVSNASCGLCGKATLDQVEASCAPIESTFRIGRSVLVGLPDALRTEQVVFETTGAVHAAACFSADGELLVLREDIGRHNALDKVIGWAGLARRVPLSDAILLVSGRISFEIVQKAALGGIPVIGAVSAPSSLAVHAADRLGITVVGFLRGERFNIYSHPARVDLSA